MNKILTIDEPFKTEEDFCRIAGQPLASRISRLADKYPRLPRGNKRMLLALSVAWALLGQAKEDNTEAFQHIDEALSPCVRQGCVYKPKGGCVVVRDTPFFFDEKEETMLHFLWDGFTIFIDYEETVNVKQFFFDFAEAHQWKAYATMREDSAQPAFLPSKPAGKPSKPMPQPQQRNYLEEMVQGVVARGDEKAVRDLLANFSYIEHNDSHTDRLRGMLLHRLEEMNRQKEAACGMTFNYYAPVGQAIGNANIDNKTKDNGTTEQKLLQ